MILAHGAGAGMNHRFMLALSDALKEHSISTLRYNFIYMDRGKKMPDPPAIAERTVYSVIKVAHDLYPDLPLFAGGKSFGGRMTSQLLSKGSIDFCRGIVFYGFPLHPEGKPDIARLTNSPLYL
jgi:predicted alpha/beta-hydrolase family hydrolase